MFFLKFMIKKLVLYAVSNDIIQHILEQLNYKNGVQYKVIYNGIDVESYENKKGFDQEHARMIIGLPLK